MIDNREFFKKVEHNKELLSNCISYLWEIWNNEDLDTILNNFKRLGFNNEDLLDFDISYELEIIKREQE